MHAVAMKPRYLSPETVPAEALEGKQAMGPDISCLASCSNKYQAGNYCVLQSNKQS